MIENKIPIDASIMKDILKYNHFSILANIGKARHHKSAQGTRNE